MKQTPPSPTALRVSALSQSTATAFDLRPDAARLAEIASALDLLGLRKLSFSGELRAEGDRDWRLTARLGATVIQPCAVTLAPVRTRIDTDVTRLYQRDFAVVDAPEAEMPADDSVEPLGAFIDPAEVMLEELALSLPLYPRVPGADLGEVVVSEPGVAPLRDEDARPFAGLGALRDRLRDENGQDD